jgi:hypothetical protein
MSRVDQHTRLQIIDQSPNKAFQTDEFVVSHLLQRAQKLRHYNFAVEQRR